MELDEGFLLEAEIKRKLRDGRRVADVLVVFTEIGGGRFVPFLRLDGDGGWFAVRMSKVASARSWRQWHVLLSKLRSDPDPGDHGGFRWGGDAVEILLPGNPRIARLGPAAADLQ